MEVLQCLPERPEGLACAHIPGRPFGSPSDQVLAPSAVSRPAFLPSFQAASTLSAALNLETNFFSPHVGIDTLALSTLSRPVFCVDPPRRTLRIVTATGLGRVHLCCTCPKNSTRGKTELEHIRERAPTPPPLVSSTPKPPWGPPGRSGLAPSYWPAPLGRMASLGPFI